MGRYVDLVENGGNWTLPLKGTKVTRCCVDYGFEVAFTDQEKAFIIAFEGGFTVEDGAIIHSLSLKNITALGPAFAILHKTVESALAGKGGRLEIHFSDGSCIIAEPDPDYESWTLADDEGPIMVCMPGGDLAIWRQAGDDMGRTV